MSLRSVPSMSGDFTAHHSENIVLYSSSDIPPFPVKRASG